MAQKDRTKTALDEARMLMLGAQVLLGFQFQAPFQNAFTQLSEQEKIIELGIAVIMILIVGLLIAPSARHRLVYDGEARPELDRFVNRISALTLAPFALALALDVAIAAVRVGGVGLSCVAGIATGLFALVFWYGPLLWKQRSENMPTSDEKTPLDAKIDYVLTEARMVLPGVQAMLGFQLAIVLTTGFAELERPFKLLHGLALASIAIATMVLIAPAAIHRIVYEGKNEAAFHRTASRLLLTATVFLAIGLSLDAYVVAFKIMENELIALLSGCGAAVALFSLWIVWPGLKAMTR